jgi:cytoskeletal protein RodZ
MSTLKINNPMKSIKRQSSRKKKYLIIVVATALVIIGGFSAYALTRITPPADSTAIDTPYQPPTNEQKNAGDTTSNGTKTDEEPLPEKPKPQDKAPDTPPTAPSAIKVDITAANQNGDRLQVRTTIATLKNGTCTLTLSRSGSTTITKTAPTQTLSSYSTCQGFDIPTASIIKGEWQLTVIFTGGDNSKGSASKALSIE